MGAERPEPRLTEPRRKAEIHAAFRHRGETESPMLHHGNATLLGGFLFP